MTGVTTIRDETRTLLRLAWPVALTSLNWTLLQVIDIVVIAQAGTHQVAGFAASRTITFVTIMIAIGGMSGILVHASRADGARELAETGAVFRSGLALALIAGAVGFVVLLAGAEPLLRAIGVAEAVLPVAATVLRIMAFAYPAQMVIVAASNWLEGVSRPRRVMIVNLIALPANATLAWTLAGGHFGFPAMGAAGAALATAIVVWGSAAGMVVAALRVPDARLRGVRLATRSSVARAVSDARNLAKFGAVPGIAAGLELAGFSILIGLSTQLGDTAAHAFTIVFSLHNLSFGVAIGLGSAAGVRVGNAVGEGALHDIAKRTLIAVALTFSIVGALAAALFVARAPVVGLFPATPEVAALATVLLAIWAPFIVFDGLQVVLLFALRSMGDQAAAGAIAVVSFFLVTGISGYLLVHAGHGAAALSWATGAGMVTAAVLMGARFAFVISRRRNSG